MICQATYSSLDAIPENLREEFEQVNGKWQLKDSAVPGVGTLFNSALAANEQRAVTQVKKRNERILALEEENNSLKDKVSMLDTPGVKVLSPEDAQTFEKFFKLGTPAEIESILNEYKEIKSKVTQFETREALGKITEAVGGKINTEVLSDWAKDAPSLTFFVKSVEQADKTMSDVAFVKIEEAKDGKVEVKERELLPFAKEVLPDWKYSALTSVSDPKERTAAGTPPKGARLPDFRSANEKPKDDAPKKPVEKFNEARASRPSPFEKPLAMPGVRSGMPV